jgi:hypothetical protein
VHHFLEEALSVPVAAVSFAFAARVVQGDEIASVVPQGLHGVSANDDAIAHPLRALVVADLQAQGLQQIRTSSSGPSRTGSASSRAWLPARRAKRSASSF